MRPNLISKRINIEPYQSNLRSFLKYNKGFGHTSNSEKEKLNNETPEPFYMRGQNPTEPATILSRIRKV